MFSLLYNVLHVSPSTALLYATIVLVGLAMIWISLCYLYRYKLMILCSIIMRNLFNLTYCTSQVHPHYKDTSFKWFFCHMVLKYPWNEDAFNNSRASTVEILHYKNCLLVFFFMWVTDACPHRVLANSVQLGLLPCNCCCSCVSPVVKLNQQRDHIVMWLGYYDNNTQWDLSGIILRAYIYVQCAYLG